jgi:hypothetical protein
MYSAYPFTTLALDGGEWSVSPRPRFTPGERTPGTHWTGGWVGPRASLDTEVRGKILCRGSNLSRPAVHSVVRHYTDWATPVPIIFLVQGSICWEAAENEYYPAQNAQCSHYMLKVVSIYFNCKKKLTYTPCF